MGGSSYTPPKPDDTLALAQMQMQGELGRSQLENQNRLLGFAANMPMETYTPNVWGAQGAEAQAGQLAQINASRSRQLEQQMNPGAASMRAQLPQMLSEDLSGGWQKQMNDWAKHQGLANYLGTGTADSTVGRSGYFDQATAQGHALRQANEAAAANYLNANQAPVAGLDVGQVIGAQEAAKAQGMQQRAGFRNAMLGNAQQNAQSTTDWINQMMSTQSQVAKSHNQNWQNYQQAMMDKSAQEAESTNKTIGAVASVAVVAAVCWVARASFGQNNPKWIEFRRSMLRNAPDAFIAFYCRHGQAIANRITNSFSRLIGRIALTSLHYAWQK